MPSLPRSLSPKIVKIRHDHFWEFRRISIGTSGFGTLFVACLTGRLRVPHSPHKGEKSSEEREKEYNDTTITHYEFKCNDLMRRMKYRHWGKQKN